MLSDDGTDRLTADVRAAEPEAAPDIFQTLWDRPMSHRGRLSLPVRGGVNLSGLDHGDTNIIGMNEVPNLGIILTLHEAGSTHWTGRGMDRGYSGASTFTVLIQPTDDSRSYRYVNLTRPVAVKTSAADREYSHSRYVERLLEGRTDS